MLRPVLRFPERPQDRWRDSAGRRVEWHLGSQVESRWFVRWRWCPSPHFKFGRPQVWGSIIEATSIASVTSSTLAQTTKSRGCTRLGAAPRAQIRTKKNATAEENGTEDDENRTRNLSIWSRTHYHCATSCSSVHSQRSSYFVRETERHALHRTSRSFLSVAPCARLQGSRATCLARRRPVARTSRLTA